MTGIANRIQRIDRIAAHNTSSAVLPAKQSPPEWKISIKKGFQKANCKACHNEHCLIKKYTSEKWLSIIDSVKSQLLYKKGLHIFREGDTIAGVYFIKYGKVKVLSTGLQGREQIVRLANDGHILGHRGYGTEDYPVSAVTMTDSLICFVDNNTLYAAFMKNPKFTYGLMQFYSRELRKIEIRNKYLAQMNVREKIAEVLLLLKETFGITLDSYLNMNLSRQEIADIAGTSVNRVTTQLNDFEAEKLIVRTKRKIKIADTVELEKIVAAFNVKKFFQQK